MKKKAFILTEILTGLALQSLFVLTLFGAFYMLLSFSTSTQQILAAHDEGQNVISYIDNRIRNAGIGMWACETPQKIAKAFLKIKQIKSLPLPVAITTTATRDMNTSVSKDGIYKGNVLTLLYAHKDRGTSGMIAYNDTMTTDTIDTVTNSPSKNNFWLLGGTISSNFNIGKYEDIRSYAVIESTGVPVFLSSKKSRDILIAAPAEDFNGAEIHPMSELLNLECERLYTGQSSGEDSLMIRSLGDDGTWNAHTPHTKGILEIYMELDTNPDVPVLDLRVLVSEGKSDGKTPQPEDWPDDYWKPEFSEHKLHVSRATWKLYNLAPLKYN